jgi:geranylgeranyl reductase family protein
MINYPIYDVSIVGAGPAGLVLAHDLAKKGVKVLLLDKNQLPHRKVCAGGLTFRAASLLPPDISSVFEGEIRGARLSYNKSPQRVRTYPQPIIYTTMRDRLDSLLASRATAAGAVFKDNTQVTGIEINRDNVLVKTESGTFLTPVLVGADGANSAIVRSLGLEKGYEYCLGVNINVEVNPDKLKEWENLIGLDYGMAGGYSWVFPKNSCLSVGSGGTAKVAKKLRPYVLDFMKAYGLDNTDPAAIQGHLMPVRKPASPLSMGRVLLVGDAAGLIDPLTGEGIYYALRSSYLASGAIIKLLESRSGDLLEYDAAINREFAQEFKIARTLRKLNSLAPRLFFHWLKDNDRFWRAFCRLLRGERTYTDLVNSLSPPLRLLFK